MSEMEMAIWSAVSASKDKDWTVRDYHKWYVKRGLLPREGYERRYGSLEEKGKK